MLRVSLIALRPAGAPWPSSLLAGCRAGLEELGHAVEVLVVSDPTARPTLDLVEPWCVSMLAPAPGLSEAAVAGLRASRADLLVLLDPSRGYAPEDVFAVVGKLAEGRADLVLAASPRPRMPSAVRRLIGTSDPLSGLVGLTREAAIAADGKLAPVGSRFAAELLARVPGRRADVAVGKVAASLGTSSPLDDVRLAKRLADDRFGTASRLIQFCFVGASGMVVDLTCYALFQALLARTALASWTLPLIGGSSALAASAVLAIGLALTWNFSLNRRLTFNDARRGSIAAQYFRYVLSNLLGIGVSLTLRLALPATVGFFARHRLAAAVAGIVAATGISFTMARWFVFDRKGHPGGRPNANRSRLDKQVRPDRRGQASLVVLQPPGRAMATASRPLD